MNKLTRTWKFFCILGNSMLPQDAELQSFIKFILKEAAFFVGFFGFVFFLGLVGNFLPINWPKSAGLFSIGCMVFAVLILSCALIAGVVGLGFMLTAKVKTAWRESSNEKA